MSGQTQRRKFVCSLTPKYQSPFAFAFLTSADEVWRLEQIFNFGGRVRRRLDREKMVLLEEVELCVMEKRVIGRFMRGL